MLTKPIKGSLKEYQLDCEESWAPKNWYFWTVVLEKTLESPLDCKEIQPVHSKRDQPWVFFGRNDAKAETPVLWHYRSWWWTGRLWTGRPGVLRFMGLQRVRHNWETELNWTELRVQPKFCKSKESTLILGHFCRDLKKI